MALSVSFGLIRNIVCGSGFGGQVIIEQHKEPEGIEKIYLPINSDANNPKVQVIACATPSTAVDYIEQFVKNNREAIEQRKIGLEEGKETDSYLLILTPAKEVKFYGKSKETIDQILTAFGPERRSFSEDYFKVLGYYSVANNPENNFTFRKVLQYEDIDLVRVHRLINQAMQHNNPLCDVVSEEIASTKRKCQDIKSILEAEDQSLDETIDRIADVISIGDKNELAENFQQKSITQHDIVEIEHQEEEEAELDELQIKKTGSIELVTIVGSKGLSADHVIVVGFDDVNMKHVTKNAFFVAITRARESLRLLSAIKSGGAKKPHFFLDQLPDEHIEYWSYTKKKHMLKKQQGKQGFKNYLINLQKYIR